MFYSDVEKAIISGQKDCVDKETVIKYCLVNLSTIGILRYEDSDQYYEVSITNKKKVVFANGDMDKADYISLEDMSYTLNNKKYVIANLYDNKGNLLWHNKEEDINPLKRSFIIQDDYHVTYKISPNFNSYIESYDDLGGSEVFLEKINSSDEFISLSVDSLKDIIKAFNKIIETVDKSKNNS